jgi:hypothetical protein
VEAVKRNSLNAIEGVADFGKNRYYFTLCTFAC